MGQPLTAIAWEYAGTSAQLSMLVLFERRHGVEHDEVDAPTRGTLVKRNSNSLRRVQLVRFASVILQFPRDYGLSFLEQIRR